MAVTILRDFQVRFLNSYPACRAFLFRGAIGLFDYWQNSKISWRLKDIGKSSNEILADETSISDGTPYIAMCKLAVEDKVIFNRFKSSEEYRSILEHVDYKLGESYLRFLKGNSESLNLLKQMTRSDFGQPYKYFYWRLGRVSPTQIRYAKITLDLEQLFGDLSGLHIIEIGSGYGGQAAHILNKWSSIKYTILDLEWPSKLASKYIQRIKVLPGNSFEIGKIENQVAPDLLISNYAFSELTRNVQNEYLNSVILGSKGGYVLFNHIHEPSQDAYSAIEFAALIPNSRMFKEELLSYPGNVLIVWGVDKRDSALRHFKPYQNE